MRIISIAPSRISLFGGGSDLPSFYREFTGCVVSLAINLRTHVEVLQGEDMWILSGHNIPLGCTTDLLYAIRKRYGQTGFHHARISSDFDGVIGAGLGSSASFSVALIGALRKLKELELDREKIAEEAYRVETSDLKLYGGKQDQYAAAFGGLNQIWFDKKVKIVPLSEDVVPYLNLFFIGGTRKSSKIQDKLKKLSKEKKAAIIKMRDLAISSKYTNVSDWGELLDEGWELKKRVTASNDRVDSIYTYARKYGATGGKLLGAGECGYMVFFVDPNKRDNFLKRMAKVNLFPTDFSQDNNGVEVRIL